MSDEWDVKRVADLVVGDEVRDYGVIIETRVKSSRAVNVAIATLSIGHWFEWPAHARVDVRRPVEITVKASASACHRYESVYVGGRFVAEFVSPLHAHEFADLLRGSADERRKALGQ